MANSGLKEDEEEEVAVEDGSLLTVGAGELSHLHLQHLELVVVVVVVDEEEEEEAVDSVDLCFEEEPPSCGIVRGKLPVNEVWLLLEVDELDLRLRSYGAWCVLPCPELELLSVSSGSTALAFSLLAAETKRRLLYLDS